MLTPAGLHRSTCSVCGGVLRQDRLQAQRPQPALPLKRLQNQRCNRKQQRMMSCPQAVSAPAAPPSKEPPAEVPCNCTAVRDRSQTSYSLSSRPYEQSISGHHQETTSSRIKHPTVSPISHQNSTGQHVCPSLWFWLCGLPAGKAS